MFSVPVFLRVRNFFLIFQVTKIKICQNADTDGFLRALTHFMQHCH
jgi:hypothetical protein